MKFSELSDNSTALNLKYEKGIVSFTYDDRASGVSYLVKIKCPRHRSCFFSIEPVGLKGCAKTCIDNLSDLISVDKYGKYTIGEKDVCLRTVRFGAVIALGLKAEEYPCLASIRTTGENITYVAVPVISEDDITLKSL